MNTILYSNDIFTIILTIHSFYQGTVVQNKIYMRNKCVSYIKTKLNALLFTAAAKRLSLTVTVISVIKSSFKSLLKRTLMCKPRNIVGLCVVLYFPVLKMHDVDDDACNVVERQHI